MTDQCFFHLNLPFNINFSVPDFPGKQNHIAYDLANVKPLVDWLDSLNLEIEFGEVFRKLPNTKFGDGIHVDGLRMDHHAKINFVIGEGIGKMCWWEALPGKKISELKTVIGTPYLKLDVDDARIVSESELKYPSIVNAGGIFHSVEDVTAPRYCFSFRIRHKNTGKRVLWHEVEFIFKDYIMYNTSHRKLKIPVKLNPPAIDMTGKRAMDLSLNLVNSELTDWLMDEFKIKLKRFQLFYVPPKSGVNKPIGVHADTNVLGACKLNWSYGAPGSIMRWFKFKEGIARPDEVPASAAPLYKGFSTAMVLPKYEELEEIYRSEICNPSLVNVYQPHDIINFSEYGRYTFTVVMLDPETDYEENLTWEKSLKVFEKYIIGY